MKICVLVSCFDSYDIRTKHIEKILIKKGYDCYHITANYNHIKKEKKGEKRKNEIQIDVLPYKKNISVRRLLSHYLFGRKTLKEIERIKPDLIYALIPPNNLIKFISKYKSENNVKLIYDIFDLWPESFPISSGKLILKPAFKIWKNLRDKHLKNADLIVTECQLYKEKLKKVVDERLIEPLYLTKEKMIIKEIKRPTTDLIKICYLGSINHILDLNTTIELVKEIVKFKPIIIHIIGDGENKDEFIKQLELAGASVEYHGKIFDENIKLEIMSSCHFGINLMKKSVSVGLTIKSVDYLNSGLPLINNIPADTFEIIEKYNVGFNISDNSISEVANKIAYISENELNTYKNNCLKVFDKFFSLESFEKRFEIIFKQI